MRRSAGEADLEGGQRPGRQQRAAARREAAPAETTAHEYEGSSYTSFLLEEWAWGHLSAPAVQRHAAKAYADQIELVRRVGGAQI